MKTLKRQTRDAEASGRPAGVETALASDAKKEPGPKPDGPRSSTQAEAAPATPQAPAEPGPTTPRRAKKSVVAPKEAKAGPPKVVNDIEGLHSSLRKLVDKLLREGSTFEDVVDWFKARSKYRVTLNAVQAYFQRNTQLQSERAVCQVEGAEALLNSLDKDPTSAEARLARAAILTGYSKVHRDTPAVTPLQAARYRMQCENLHLKHQILEMQRGKAKQELDYSKAKTDLIKATNAKVQTQILALERELRARQASGAPIGNDILEKIQQLFGLACQPLLYEEMVNAQKP
jgi:hypothetical protein